MQLLSVHDWGCALIWPLMQHSDSYNPSWLPSSSATHPLGTCSGNVKMIGLPLQGQGYLHYQEMSWTSSFGTTSTAASTSSPRELSPTALRRQTLARLSHTSGQLGRRYAARMSDGRETYRRLSVYTCMRGLSGAKATQRMEVLCFKQLDTRWPGARGMSDRQRESALRRRCPQRRRQERQSCGCTAAPLTLMGMPMLGSLGPLL